MLHASLPQHFLNLSPEPHGHFSFGLAAFFLARGAAAAAAAAAAGARVAGGAAADRTRARPVLMAFMVGWVGGYWFRIKTINAAL